MTDMTDQLRWVSAVAVGATTTAGGWFGDMTWMAFGGGTLLLLSIAERIYTFFVIKPRQRRLLDAQIAQITGD